MNYVTTATSFPPLCRHYGQHGQKCEAQEVSWSRTHKQLEAWLRTRPRITGSAAEKLARMGGTSACWVQDITESTEGGAMHHLREGFSFFLANSHNRGHSSRVWHISSCYNPLDTERHSQDPLSVDADAGSTLAGALAFWAGLTAGWILW